MESRRVSVLSVVVLLAGTPLAYAQSPVAALSEARPWRAPSHRWRRRSPARRRREAAANTRCGFIGGQDDAAHLEFGDRDLVVVIGGGTTPACSSARNTSSAAITGSGHTDRPRSVMTLGMAAGGRGQRQHGHRDGRQRLRSGIGRRLPRAVYGARRAGARERWRRHARQSRLHRAPPRSVRQRGAPPRSAPATSC